MTDKIKPEFNIDADATKLKELIHEGSTVMTKIEVLKEEIKALKDTAKEELGVEGKKFSKLLSMYHKANRDEVEDEANELTELYDKVFNGKAEQD